MFLPFHPPRDAALENKTSLLPEKDEKTRGTTLVRKLPSATMQRHARLNRAIMGASHVRLGFAWNRSPHRLAGHFARARSQGKLSASGFPSLVARSRLLLLVIASCKHTRSVYAISVRLAIVWPPGRPVRTLSDASLPARPSLLPPRSPGDWHAPRECAHAASREAVPADSHRSRGGR